MRQRLARALRVPDHAAGAGAVLVEGLDALQRRLDDEVLLVAGELLVAALEQGEAVGQVEQTLRAAEAVDRLVLLRDSSRPSASSSVEVRAGERRTRPRKAPLWRPSAGRLTTLRPPPHPRRAAPATAPRTADVVPRSRTWPRSC